MMPKLKTQSDKSPPNAPPRVASNADGPVGDILDKINQLVKKGKSLKPLAQEIERKNNGPIN